MFATQTIPLRSDPSPDSADPSTRRHRSYRHGRPRRRIPSLPTTLADEIVTGVNELPSRLASLAARGKLFLEEGPFPVRHPDLFHSNVIVTETFDVLGVIDWEGAYTVPWELIDPPSVVVTVPRRLNPPEQYDEAGLPLDADQMGAWEEERAYADMVRAAEIDAGADDRLSRVLANRDLQDLAGIVHLFTQGKMGFYGRALDYLESR